MINSRGYVLVYEPRHAAAQRNGWVLEHRKVWTDAGREIPRGHVLHHINHNKADNRLENLACVTRSEHARHHFPEREMLEPGRQERRRKSLIKYLSEHGVWNKGMAACRSLTCAECGTEFQRLRREADKQERKGRKPLCGRLCLSRYMNRARAARGEG